MKPWESPQPDEDIIDAWEAIHTRQLYYATTSHKEGGMTKTFVFIVPGDFFDETGFMYANSMPIVPLLPVYLDEIADNVYETAIRENLVSLALMQLGFIHDPKFQTFIEQHGYPYSKEV